MYSDQTNGNNQLFTLDNGVLSSRGNRAWFGSDQYLKVGNSPTNFKATFHWEPTHKLESFSETDDLKLNKLIRIDEILSIYRYQFLSDLSTHLVRIAYLENLNKQTFLYKSNPLVSDEDILVSLKYRYPVYYGRIIKDAYKESELKNMLGYSTQDVTDGVSSNIVMNARYAICGPVLGVDNKSLRDDVWVIHVWGVNFETKYTEDYKEMVSNGIIDQNKYRDRCNELYKSILNCGVIIHDATGKQVRVNIPGIGQGAFLSAISSNQKTIARQIHAQTLKETFKSGGFVQQYYRSNLFDLPNPSDDIIYCLVNAWDTRSFVGNGGAQDPTIDGYMVSGVGEGAIFPNSSYLHNTFFSEHLFDPNTWYE